MGLRHRSCLEGAWDKSIANWLEDAWKMMETKKC